MRLPVPALGRRLVAAIAATAAVTATLIVGPLALRSSAASYTVDNEATWRAALVSAAANTGETNTITLTGDFAMNDPSGTWPTYAGVTHDLIIDGGGHTVTSAAGNAASFLEAYADGGNVTLRNITLDGFTLSHAFAIDITGDVLLEGVTVENTAADTSAVYLYGNTVTVDGSTFTNNTSDGDGGALYVPCDSTLTIQNSTFTGNSSSSNGGALSTSCDLAIYDSTFTSNTADFSGGAIYGGSNVDIDYSTFTGNSAGWDAGAVNSDGEVGTFHATFIDNHAVEGYGGAIWAQYGAYTDHSTFQGNSAAYDGGGVYVYEGPFAAEESAFADNIAGESGGGAYGYIYADSYSTTWSGNEASYGGAMYSESAEGYTWIEESTFIGNAATDDGGAVYLVDGWVETYNSVFSGNEADYTGAHIYVTYDVIETYATVFAGAVGSDGCYADGGVDSTGFNFDDDGTCTDDWAGIDDFGFDGEDPMLGALADNGGPTQTLEPLQGSPLIDAIPWEDCDYYSVSSSDQRGVDRAAAGAADFGCDIGSVEVIPDLSFPIVGESGTTTVTVEGALDWGCNEWTPIAGYVPTPPAGVSFPHGVLSYCLQVPGDGWTVTVSLDFPSPVTQLWKETDGTWAQVPGAVISGTTITYDVTDGGTLDDDGVADSTIVDPVAGARGASFTG